jgi:hypothetical protein
MNDILLDPPSPPQPEKKDTLTFNKKNLAIAFLAVSIFILILALVIPGSNSSSPATNDAPAPAVTNPPYTPPAENKYDQYMDHVLNNSGQANTWSKSDVIEFGDLVCGALDKGNSISSVVNLLQGYAKSNSDIEFFASVAYGSITYICPEYKPDLDVYLAN